MNSYIVSVLCLRPVLSCPVLSLTCDSCLLHVILRESCYSFSLGSLSIYLHSLVCVTIQSSWRNWNTLNETSDSFVANLFPDFPNLLQCSHPCWKCCWIPRGFKGGGMLDRFYRYLEIVFLSLLNLYWRFASIRVISPSPEKVIHIY